MSTIEQLDMFADVKAPVPATSGAKPPPPDGGKPTMPAPQVPGPLRDLINENFLNYASYVIRDRAIPDLDDGLKPVQRRILWSLHERDDGKFIKVANIVGYCMQYHPHGDASIGDALVALANKNYLIEGQGNFGNVLTGDSAAAARYIECRLTDLAREHLFHDELTEFVPSYDGRNQEPVTLPAKLPLLLMLGADGIAVGLSTRILPHNFVELIEAQIAILQKKPFKLLPDFQQGGVLDASEYEKGNGKVRVRAVMEKKGPDKLVIRELPFGTTTESLIASIEDAARKKKVKVKSINDFTAEHIEIEVSLQPDEDANKAMQALFAFTQCESSLSTYAVVIDQRKPVVLDVDEILRRNTARLLDLLKKELQHQRKKLQDELHAKSLVQIFVENRIYKKIEECKTQETVRQAVFDGVNAFRHLLLRDVTQADIDMLLEVRIKRISLFDINKNREEMDDIVRQLKETEKNLGELVPHAIRYLRGLLRVHGERYPRRTKVQRFETVEVRELTANELTLSHDKATGYFGHAVEGDVCFACSSLDKVMLAWADGRYKMMPPPDKLFVDQNLLYRDLYKRDQVMTAVYTAGGITYLKRFTFGGAIMNKDYLFTLPDAKVWLLTDADPETIYVIYAPAKSQRINQQIFHPRDVAVKGVSARGVQMTVKEVKAVGLTKPRGWDDKELSPKGSWMK
ncbi:MAG TPA: DNA topoisomerase IV subunit A [Kiritimatiellia bacterium]|nr:DNA topoisomerase IV subunit A [Kiritimatiellia bacterium]